jgi:hypothetical protein
LNLAVTISLYGGGPGSGCVGPNCGRPVSYVKNTRTFIAPPKISGGESPLDHYVVEPDGESKRVLSHISYFSGQSKLGYNDFLKQGGITVTVSAGGPGIAFGKKDEETVDKVLQVAGHPEFREFGSTVEYYNPATREQLTFNGSRVGELAREMRMWLSQKKAA